MNAGPELRAITADDWAAFRTLRHPESVWRDRAEGPGPVVMAFRR